MSTIACDTPRSALDETAWRAVCKTAAEHAQRGCGLSWDHWVTLFRFGDRRASQSVAA